MEEVEGLFAPRQLQPPAGRSSANSLVRAVTRVRDELKSEGNAGERGGDREESVGSAPGFSSSQDELDVSVSVFSKMK